MSTDRKVSSSKSWSSLTLTEQGDEEKSEKEGAIREYDGTHYHGEKREDTDPMDG